MTARSDHIVADALKAISFTYREGEREFVCLPVQYPSGSMTSLELAMGKNHVTISDMGQGLWEAEMLCVDTCYALHARAEAAAAGIRFDGHSVLALEIPTDALASGMIAVANASARAAARAIQADSEKRARNQADTLYDKLKFAFPGGNVLRQAEVHGARNPWEVHNIVQIDRRRAIFEPFRNHPNSIAAKFLMFSDLRDEQDLVLNAVAEDKSQMSPKAHMLAEVAHAVLQENDEIDAFRQALTA